ncbi:A/G-specific adenine glycosylase [Limoniibacter endophyticus]|uniref:Adenine DNA glycosylase n=1 Tax=Limoniibacter endophyticus TaxID=1565040 RepID=A0A8J3DQC5_9HYPH|nr:A/G-specific adenine glycosylase [Limoniibacter endophyticus]GHC71609.1 A/G-specific adenine glycosylase [Limoniibacter endophyticus]
MPASPPTASKSPCPQPLLGQKLLDWYDRHHRDLPWRTTPAAHAKGERADPYRVWLSEIMLQQTTVEAVKAYFRKFTERWPTITELSAADPDDIMKAWAGLGYYSRARNLKKCADLVVAAHQGKFPESEAALKALPGIGDYTAAAIASIAFDIPAAVVDGNVERVISRVFTVETPLPAAKPEIRELVAATMPEARAGDFAQAMMDLGATICTPKRPVCLHCPLRDDCLALRQTDPERYPLKAPKKERPSRQGAAFVAQRSDGAVLLRKRPSSGLLAEMAEVPTTAWTAKQDGDTSTNSAPFAAAWRFSGQVKHVFTHFELRLDVYHASVPDMVIQNGWWTPITEIHEEALPTVMKKAIEAAIPSATKRSIKQA